MCAYSVLTPYPGTLLWYQMGKAGSIVSYDWDKYDQGHIVYQPQSMTTDQLREGDMRAYSKFYSLASMAQRFPLRGSRSRTQWSIYNMFFRRGEVTGRDMKEPIAAPTPAPLHAPNPPILPVKREWREAVLEGLRESKSA
jgi:hypothetical protein